MRRVIIYMLLVTISLPGKAVEPDTIFNRLFRQDIGGWIAADATYSILLPDGRTLWLFGDTFIGEVENSIAIKPGAKFIRNSAVIQDGDSMRTLYSGTASNPSAYIPTVNPDSTWYWPEHGVVENDTLRIFVAKFRTNPDGPPGFNFEFAGNDIANFSFPELTFINAIPVLSYPLNDVVYGDRILSDSIYYYIYGRKNDDPNVNIPYPHVARAEKGQLMKQEWVCYNGSGWSADPADTRRINNFQVSQQYSVSAYRGKYILLTQDIWLSPKIWTFTSSSPVGPWKNKTLIYTTPESSEDVFTYNAYAHPQFNEDGKLLVSYNVNGDFWSIFSNVELYRPRFIRVPYMNLDFDFWPTASGSPTKNRIPDASIFPNPAADFTTLSFILADYSDLSLEIMDYAGRIIQTHKFHNLPPGDQRIELDLSGLPGGMYLCRMITMQYNNVMPFIKSSTF